MAYFEGLKQGIYGEPAKPEAKAVPHVNKDLMKQNVVSYLKRWVNATFDVLRTYFITISILNESIVCFFSETDLSEAELKWAIFDFA